MPISLSQPTQPFFYASAATDPAIRSAYNAAVAAGGGTVMIPKGTITLTSALPLHSDIFYEGAGASWNMYGGLISSGTILVGDGTFNCFEYNPTDKGSAYASTALLMAAQATGGGVKNLAMRNFLYGIKAGAKFEAGIHQFLADNVIAESCAQWGYWFENCHCQTLGTVVFSNCGVGGFYKGASGTTLWNYGNDKMDNIMGQNTSGAGSGYTTIATRGIVFEARGSTSELNDCHVYKVLSIGPGLSYSGTATFTNTSANISVPDLTKFALANPVAFTTGVAGFSGSGSRAYFVVAMSAASGSGTIQLATTKGGTAQAATASTTDTINTRGGALMEMGGLDSTALLTYCTASHMDLENGGTISYFQQRTKGHFANITLSDQQTTFQYQAYLTSMDQSNQIYLSQYMPTFYLDSNGVRVNGYKPNTIINKRGLGILFNEGTFAHDINVTDKTPSAGADIGWRSDDFPSIGFNFPMAPKQATMAAAGTIDVYTASQYIYTGAGGESSTLPALTATAKGAMFWFINPSAGNWTLNRASTDTIKGKGASGNSIVLATLTMVTLVACNNGGTLFWAAQ